MGGTWRRFPQIAGCSRLQAEPWMPLSASRLSWQGAWSSHLVTLGQQGLEPGLGRAGLEASVPPKGTGLYHSCGVGGGAGGRVSAP